MPQDHCACPGPNAIAPTGCCPRCGVAGRLRAVAVRDALASGNWRPAIEDARQRGWAAGHRAGLAEGRRQVIDALTGTTTPAPQHIGTAPARPATLGAAA